MFQLLSRNALGNGVLKRSDKTADFGTSSAKWHSSMVEMNICASLILICFWRLLLKLFSALNAKGKESVLGDKSRLVEAQIEDSSILEKSEGEIYGRSKSRSPECESDTCNEPSTSSSDQQKEQMQLNDSLVAQHKLLEKLGKTMQTIEPSSLCSSNVNLLSHFQVADSPLCPIERSQTEPIDGYSDDLLKNLQERKMIDSLWKQRAQTAGPQSHNDATVCSPDRFQAWEPQPDWGENEKKKMLTSIWGEDTECRAVSCPAPNSVSIPSIMDRFDHAFATSQPWEKRSREKDENKVLNHNDCVRKNMAGFFVNKLYAGYDFRIDLPLKEHREPSRRFDNHIHSGILFGDIVLITKKCQWQGFYGEVQMNVMDESLIVFVFNTVKKIIERKNFRPCEVEKLTLTEEQAEGVVVPILKKQPLIIFAPAMRVDEEESEEGEQWIGAIAISIHDPALLHTLPESSLLTHINGVDVRDLEFHRIVAKFSKLSEKRLNKIKFQFPELPEISPEYMDCSSSEDLSPMPCPVEHLSFREIEITASRVKEQESKLSKFGTYRASTAPPTTTLSSVVDSITFEEKK